MLSDGSLPTKKGLARDVTDRPLEFHQVPPTSGADRVTN